MNISSTDNAYAIAAGNMKIEAQHRVSSADVVVSHLDLVESHKHILTPKDAYRVDLCLTPRLPSRMRLGHWAPSRYEQPGRVFVVPPEETLAVWNAKGRETVVVCHIFTAAIARWLENDIEPAGQRKSQDYSPNIDSATIQQLMFSVTREVRNPGFATDLMIEALTMQLAVELQRHFRTLPSSSRPGGLAPWRLRLIEERVISADEPPSLTELAELCDLSVRQLARGFRASRGQPIGQYVSDQRISKARQHLDSDRSIKEIAYQLGFSSSAAFSYAFRRATGITPSDYRLLKYKRS